MVKFTEENEIILVEEYNAILVGVQINEDISYSMEELSGLAEAAGIVVHGMMYQNKEKPNSATYIGKGKVEELREMCENMGCNLVIFNDELSGVQLRNLEERLEVKVIDRTILILDIFASRAVTKEGKLQVELAQLQYRMPRLTGFGASMSKLRSGVGARGPGEKKLETDRRHIAGRMDEIKREIGDIKHNRNVQRSKREKSGIPVVALVGYTNSGKSALMNKFLQMAEKDEKSVMEKDMLFATLDTSQRSIKLENNREFILIDTVGFVSKLPHALVNAFKSTLEEVNHADLLIHVVDATFPEKDFHIEVTNKVLKEIGAGDKEKITVYNKIDLFDNQVILFPDGNHAINISAKTGLNMEALIDSVKEHIFSDIVTVELLIPYDRGDISSYFCEKCNIETMDYWEEGTFFKIELNTEDYNRYSEYMIDNN